VERANLLSSFSMTGSVMALPKASLGAVLGGFRVGETLALEHLRVPDGFEPLGARFREGTRSRWPESYRFQVSRRSWRVNVRSESGTVQSCVLQCAVLPQERTLANAELDFVDAGDAVAYASRFNSHQQQQAEGESAPTVKVAVPAVCSVVESCFPAMIPQGTACTLTPFPDVDVQKFVFDGTEDFLELPQTFFHYAAFSSNGKHFACDLQGTQTDSGDIILIDPVILRAAAPSVNGVVNAAAGAAMGGTGPQAIMGPTGARFDELHPKCAQLCHSFDAGRKTAKRNVGLCGMGGACGLSG